MYEKKGRFFCLYFTLATSFRNYFLYRFILLNKLKTSKWKSCPQRGWMKYIIAYKIG